MQVMETIKDASAPSSHKILTKFGRWRGFAKDPVLSGRSVIQTFSYLEGVIQGITMAGSPKSSHCKPTLSFENNPDCTMSYEHRSNSTFPDALLLLEGDRRAWTHIAVCGEYQKENTPGHVKEVSFHVFHYPLNIYRSSS